MVFLSDFPILQLMYTLGFLNYTQDTAFGDSWSSIELTLSIRDKKSEHQDKPR